MEIIWPRLSVSTLSWNGPNIRVGGFSLDLIGMDLTNDAVLIVENQLEATDHGHLGQIMT